MSNTKGDVTKDVAVDVGLSADKNDDDSDGVTFTKKVSSGSSSAHQENSFAPLRLMWQHVVSIDVVARRLATNLATGLTTAEAIHRLHKHGANILTPPPQSPWWRELLSHFSDFFSLLLLFAAALCLVAYLYNPRDILHLYLAVILTAIVAATSTFTYMQQRSSDRILRQFRSFLPPTATVLRDGKPPTPIAAAHLVVGDVVLLKPGDKLPADVRIIHSTAFAVDNASLTGESTPIVLSSAVCTRSEEDALNATNVAFFGCFAVEGTATAVVIATGDHTVFGAIAALAASDKHVREEVQTTLQRDLHHFVVNVSIFAFSVGVLFFLIGLRLYSNIVHNIIYTIGIIVSNIPEGLLATVTLSLTASARRMAKKKVLVKQLDAVEALGSTTVIVTDKTGTLTQNRMSVAHVACGGSVHVIDDDWRPPTVNTTAAEASDVGTVDAFQALLHAASVCSTATFIEPDTPFAESGGAANVEERNICGDASEAGILRFSEQFHDTMAYRRRHAVVASVPFSSKNKFMVTVTRMSVDGDDGMTRVHVVMKGAAEYVLARSESVRGHEGVRTMTEEDRGLMERQVSYFAQRGERVLGVAERILSGGEARRVVERSRHGLRGEDDADMSMLTTGLRWIGLMAMTDPPRQGVSDAVERCRSAGVRVIMVTGDHVETAVSIAQIVGIVTQPVDALNVNSDGVSVVTGARLSEMGRDKLTALLKGNDELVIARASPQHKLEIVERLQKLGNVVTVTGDGCNDAPALKRANVGVAMGRSGSDVSRSAAEVVLLDDSFPSLVSGIEEGRIILDNLKKSVAYTLTSNVAQLVPFVALLMLSMPLPITTVLVLCIDLGTDVFPAIALAYEGPEGDVMGRGPRGRGERLVTGRLVSYSSLQLGVMQTLAGFLAFLVLLNDYGLAPGVMPGLASRGRFGTRRSGEGRWMFAEQGRVGGVGQRTGWFAREGRFEKYFASAAAGVAEQQTVESFEDLRADGETDSQFGNMVKILAVETGRPPCLSFQCRLRSGVTVQDDAACVDSVQNAGGIGLIGAENRTANGRVLSGFARGEGCFELWSPQRSRAVLRRGQTAFFAAIVVTQLFTLAACRTRTASLFSGGGAWNWNWMLAGAVAVESVLAVVVVYVRAVGRVLGTRPIRAEYWVVGVPFGMAMVAYDEGRKWFLRRHLRNLRGEMEAGSGVMDLTAKWVYDLTMW